ncbi:MAG TPA: hypothetical protein PLI97_04550 [Fluviicola sp.]|nr:hypothetical protein [Fluviicola sp.]
MKTIFPAAFIALFLSACGGNNEQNNVASIDSEAQTETVSEDNDYVLPQPITLANAFKEAGLKFQDGKANPTSKVDAYSMKIDQLLNLGVYSTELAYCAINGKAQEAREYLSVIQKLGGKVGLESVFSDKELIEKFDKELSNPEQLEDLIYDIQDRTDVYMENNDLKYLGDIQFAGAWIEGMYLGIDQTKERLEVGKTLVEQMSLLKNILKGFKSHPAQEDVRLKEIIGLYEKILTTYQGLESVKKVGNNINVETPKLTEDEFAALANKVVAARNNVVKPGK